MAELTGLSAQEVLQRRQQGEGNDVKLSTSRSILSIIRNNVFNPVNVILYVISLGLILVGEFKSAFATVMLVILNAIVGIVQEVRAKRQLDQIALLSRAQVTVRRDGQDEKIDP